MKSESEMARKKQAEVEAGGDIVVCYFVLGFSRFFLACIHPRCRVACQYSVAVAGAGS